MNLASDPTIQRKITRMAERVRWKQPALTSRGIDQTRLVLDPDGDQPGQGDAFHVLVLGDSGTGRHRFHSPPRRIAERLLPHKPDAAFLLHTGDVFYLVGALFAGTIVAFADISASIMLLALPHLCLHQYCCLHCHHFHSGCCKAKCVSVR